NRVPGGRGHHRGLRHAAIAMARLQRTISPVDGSVVVERPLASNADIEAALTKAVAAQKVWRRVPVRERAEACRRMALWCVERADVIGNELTRQMGRPIAHTRFETRRGFQERVAYMPSIAEEALADVRIEPKDGFSR